jgi:cytosine/adenosine deaminase-related metal-dependent hydrolase
MSAVTRRTALAGLAVSGLPIGARAAGTDLLISGARLITMDDRLGDLPSADVRIRGDRIVAVGVGLPRDGAEIIDGRGAIVLPGFVDTHWHMWNEIARNRVSSVEGGFAPTMAAVAPFWTPQDSAAGVSLALSEAAAAGITTAVNWAHNTRSPAHARAEYAAHARSGVRGRFAYGYPADARADVVMDLADLARMAAGALDPMVSLGVCLRGPDRSEEAVWRREWAPARKLGLPISTHTSYDAASAARHPIARLAQAGFLGPDTMMVHATHASDADLALLAKAGAPLSLSPWTELEVGYGVPPIGRMMAAKVAISLSNDNVVLAGRIDMFAVMKLSIDLLAGETGSRADGIERRALRWATIDGARALGMAASIGSITPGKMADIIMVRPGELRSNGDDAVDRWLTHAAAPEDIELVLVGGRSLKRDGKLTRNDIPALAGESIHRVAEIARRAHIRKEHR